MVPFASNKCVCGLKALFRQLTTLMSDSETISKQLNETKRNEKHQSNNISIFSGRLVNICQLHLRGGEIVVVIYQVNYGFISDKCHNLKQFH